MKRILIVFIALFAIVSVNAQEKSKNKKVSIAVKGNCEMCKMRIEKAALDTKGVKYANWDVASKELALIINENKTDIKTVQANIAGIGHDTQGVKATDEAYNGLHGCCKYERESVSNKAKSCSASEGKKCCAKKEVKSSCASDTKECKKACDSKKKSS